MKNEQNILDLVEVRWKKWLTAYNKLTGYGSDSAKQRENDKGDKKSLCRLSTLGDMGLNMDVKAPDKIVPKDLNSLPRSKPKKQTKFFEAVSR